MSTWEFWLRVVAVLNGLFTGMLTLSVTYVAVTTAGWRRSWPVVAVSLLMTLFLWWLGFGAPLRGVTP